MRKRLGDVLGHRGRSHSSDPHLDKIAQRIFPVNKEAEECADWFLAASPPTEGLYPRVGALIGPELGKVLGEYEYRLLDKVLFPAREPGTLCIVGPIGSGKSMSLNMVLHALETIAASRQVGGKALVCRLDLNLMDPGAERLDLIRALTSHLVAALHDAFPDVMSREWQVTAWWPLLFRDGSEGLSRRVRGRLIDELHQSKLASFDGVNARMEQYLRTYEQLRADPEWYFQYMLSLWGYVKTERFRDAPDLAVIAIDSLDWLEPRGQQGIVASIIPYIHLASSTLLLAMRPATYMVNGVGAWLVDAELHEGPAPSDVLAHCVERFRANPRKYFGQGEVSEASGRDICHRLDGTATALVQERFCTFVDQMFGTNKRAVLACAHALVKFREDPRSREGLSAHNLARLLIRRGAEFYSYEGNPDVENVFTCHGQRDVSLCKVRTLIYLRRCGRDRVDIGVLVNHLAAFGYDPNLTAACLDQLASQTRQLIISNERLSFLGIQLEQARDRIALTPMGMGYVDYAMTTADYITEVMADCAIDDTSVVLTNRSGVGARFAGARAVLRELERDDFAEVEKFMKAMEVVKEDGRREYMSVYGVAAISHDIRERVGAACHSIFNSIITDMVSRSDGGAVAEARDEFETILSGFVSDQITATTEWARILREAPASRLTPEMASLAIPEGRR